MFEIRKDYLTETMALMSDTRNDRPLFYNKSKRLEINRDKCPFCRENSSLMPSILHESGGGRVVTCKNKYPAVSDEDGAHYVVVDTDCHDEKFASFSPQNISLVLKELIRLYKTLIEKDGIEYVHIFKNDGGASGASISHSHWQVVGLPFIGERACRIHKNQGRFFDECGKSYIGHLPDITECMVWQGDYVFAYMPIAAAYCAQVNIAPLSHVPRPDMLSGDCVDEMALCLKTVINGMFKFMGEFSFNICFQAPPKGDYSKSHFFIELIPRIGNIAGMEFGSGVYINSYFPEIVAPRIRSCIVKEDI